MPLTLQLKYDTYCIHRFQTDTEIPTSALNAPFYSITRTDDELSIVVPQSIQLDSDKQENDWRCLKVLGPLDFSLTGILARISNILAEAEISIFAISTFDTDYILIKSEKIDQAVGVLRKASYIIQSDAL